MSLEKIWLKRDNSNYMSYIFICGEKYNRLVKAGKDLDF